MGAVTMVAGTVDLTELMAMLQNERPVFHSEADFQHALAWALHRLDPSVNIRLEVPQDDGERHEGRTATGTLRWGTAPDFFLQNERTLAGTYPMEWHNYSTQTDANGVFRWLAACVDCRPFQSLPVGR